MTTTTARSKHYLEKLGWKCWTVEQMVRIPPMNGQPGKMFKRDCFNMFDLLCFKPGTGIMGVQTTTTSNQAARLTKIQSIPESDGWLNSGGKIQIHGWKKSKSRWVCTVQELGPDQDFQSTNSLLLGLLFDNLQQAATPEDDF